MSIDNDAFSFHEVSVNYILSFAARDPSVIPRTPNIILGPTSQVAIARKTSSVTFECFASGRYM